MSANDLLEREKTADNGGDTDNPEQKKIDARFAALTNPSHYKKNADAPHDQVGRGYQLPYLPHKGTKPPADSLLKGRVKKWGIGVLISLALGGGGFTLFNIASGPGEFIHLAKLLQKIQLDDGEKHGNGRMGQLWRWMRTIKTPEKRNLSYYGNKFADHYEKKLVAAGIKPGYVGGRIKTLTIDTNTNEGKKAVQSLREQGVDIDSLRPNERGVIIVDIDRPGAGSARFRRIAISGMVGAAGMRGLSGAMASRLLKIRAGVDFHPLKNAARAADEDFKDWRRKVKERKAERIRNGAQSGPRAVTPGENPDTNNPDADGQNQAAGETSSAANETIGDATDPNATVEERASKIRAKLTAGVGVTALMALVCGVQAIGDEVGKTKHLNMVLPLIRSGMDAITTGFQIMSGVDVNPEEMGVARESLYDAQKNSSWSEARSIQAETGEKQTGPDMPEGSKPGNATKQPFFIVIDKFLGAIPGAKSFCGAVTSTAGGLILSAVGVAAAATGPFSLLLNAAAEAGQYILVGAFLDDLVRWLAGEQVEKFPAGALYGNYVNYGARLAANDTAMSQGGRELSVQEEEALALENRAINREADKHKSFYARYFDLNEVDSLAARIVFRTPALTNTDAARVAISRMPANLFSSITGPFFSLFSRNANAAPLKYDYGFPKMGFSVAEQNGEGDKNPYERSDRLEPRLAELNEEYGDCFNMTVNPTSFQLVSGPAKRYDEIGAHCKDANNAELTQYRFYISDMVAMKTAVCYDNLDKDACREIGFGARVTNTTGTTIDMENLFKDSTGETCAEGTRDLGAQGVQDGWHGGEMVKIKLCAVPDIPCNNQECTALSGGEALVNARVSGAYAALAKAAKAASVPMFANSSFRTMAHQQQLCSQNPGCANGTSYARVAKPGTSNHQMGIAIDFGDGAGNAINTGDKWHTWLSQNAGTYGIKPYPAESWHWSPTGS